MDIYLLYTIIYVVLSKFHYLFYITRLTKKIVCLGLLDVQSQVAVILVSESMVDTINL